MLAIEDYINFWQEYEGDLNIEAKSLCFAFKDNELLVKKGKEDETSIKVPTKEDLKGIEINEEDSFHLGRLRGTSCFLVKGLEEVVLPDDLMWQTLRDECWLEDKDLFFVAIKAQQLLGWDSNTQYCGKCGTKNSRDKNERAKRCPSCGRIEYPRISPAIIVAIKKGNEVLLASNKKFKEGLYGVIAGFVEQGETLEQAVRREVYEEVGIRVKNIKYFQSNPWINSDSLMIGFTAEYESGEIRVDGKEIIDAGWYSKDHLPPRIPLKISTARALIDYVLEME